MSRKHASKKRRRRERKEAQRSGMEVEQLRDVKAGGTGKEQRRNKQAHVPGYNLHESFRQEMHE